MPLFKYEAVVAKCRSLYGKLLKPADYENLLKCAEVSEIAAYLHDNTAYGEFLKDSNLSSINRNKLEYYIKKSLLRDYMKMYKFTSGDQRHFISLLMTRFELEYILKVWREYVSRNIANNPAAEENDDYLINESLLDIWTIYQNNPRINLAALKNIKDAEQFKEAVKNSYYSHVFEKYIGDNITQNYTELETALYDEYYENLYRGAAVFETEIRKKIEDSISIQADLINLCRISRMMFNFRAPTNEILPLLIPLRKKLKEENIKELLKCPDRESFFLYCQSLYYGAKQSFYEYQSMTDYMNDFLDKYYKTIMNLTSMGFDIVVRYFRIKEIEIRNLFYLIEGIRYRMSLEEIKKHVRT
ncbi:MAG: V-type ATPase subunit [Oscillospiraceae bacterium]|nr:V-type ATPase subunit [Oscillospiraceae bacterium]